MTHTVGPKGQVVIPKPMRAELGLEPGDQVSFSLEDGAVRVAPANQGPSMRGRFAGLGLTDALEADRRSERD